MAAPAAATDPKLRGPWPPACLLVLNDGVRENHLVQVTHGAGVVGAREKLSVWEKARRKSEGSLSRELERTGAQAFRDIPATPVPFSAKPSQILTWVHFRLFYAPSVPIWYDCSWYRNCHVIANSTRQRLKGILAVNRVLGF